MTLDEIINTYKKEYMLSEQEIDKVKYICKKKMKLNNKPDDYMNLLLPDELKNYCIRNAVNFRSLSRIALKEV